jgi:hypothetical protein
MGYPETWNGDQNSADCRGTRNDGGFVRRRRLQGPLLALGVSAALSSCNNAPSSPTRIDLAGRWSGPTLLADCVQVGGDPRSCANMMFASRAGELTLELSAPVGNAISGTFVELYGTPLPVTGSIDFNGRVTLTGRMQLPDTMGAADRKFSLETFEASVSGNALIGRYTTIDSSTWLSLIPGPFRQTMQRTVTLRR